MLNWHIKHKGHLVIPKTSNLKRLRENLFVYDFELDEKDYLKIDELDKKARFYDPLYFGYGIWRNYPYF